MKHLAAALTGSTFFAVDNDQGSGGKAVLIADLAARLVALEAAHG